VKAKDLLRHYATRLKTNEVNYTFNNLLTQRNIDSWTEQTPDDLRVSRPAAPGLVLLFVRWSWRARPAGEWVER
jgi:Protein of unknown function DUF72